MLARLINDFTNTSENEISLCTAGIPVTSLVNHTFFSGVWKIYVAGAKQSLRQKPEVPISPIHFYLQAGLYEGHLAHTYKLFITNF